MGDPSDNIPGVRGIGPKGAANLLQEFDSVQGVYDHLDAVACQGHAQKAGGRAGERLPLAGARPHALRRPVAFDGEALRFEGVSPEILDVLLRRYEFRSLEPRLAELPVVGGGELPTPERLAVRLSEEPIEPSFEPVAVAPVGDGRWAVAVAEDEVQDLGRVAGPAPAGSRREEGRGQGRTFRHVPGCVPDQTRPG